MTAINKLERGCSDCLAPGYRLGIDESGHEIVTIDHDAGCPHEITGGPS